MHLITLKAKHLNSSNLGNLASYCNNNNYKIITIVIVIISGSQFLDVDGAHMIAQQVVVLYCLRTTARR